MSFESRKQAFIADVLANANPEDENQWIVLAKYSNQTIDGDRFRERLTKLDSNRVVDFLLIKLARILQYRDEYDQDIINAIKEKIEGFWLYEGNDIGVYWSENHWLMWHSVSLALNQMFPNDFPLPKNFRERIMYYLQEKIDSGFTEFYSSTYWPYSMSGLVNLYDFASDPEMKDLAEQASLRLLRDWVRLSTDKGAWFVVQGRFTNGNKVSRAFNHNHQECIAFLTGKGPIPSATNELAAGIGFLAVTDLNVSKALDAQVDLVDERVTIGLSTAEHRRKTEKALSDPYDRNIAGWTMGRYFTAEEADLTFDTISHYEMWENHQFEDFAAFRYASPSFAKWVANVMKAKTGSSVLNGDAVIYRYKDAMISSMQSYFPGTSNAQQLPWVATTGTLAVNTIAGKHTVDWEDDKRRRHSHMPNLVQKKNVALIMYMANRDLKFLGGANDPVALLWNETAYDETKVDGNWLLGREDDAYIAVYRPCLDDIEGILACKGDKQIWACVVGHADTHGSFANFSTTISSATVLKDEMIGCVKGFVQADGQEIELKWCQGSTPLTALIICIGIYAMLALTATLFACRARSRSVNENRWTKRKLCSILTFILVIFYPGFFLAMGIALVGDQSTAAYVMAGLGITAFIALHIFAIIWLKRQFFNEPEEKSSHKQQTLDTSAPETESPKLL